MVMHPIKIGHLLFDQVLKKNNTSNENDFFPFGQVVKSEQVINSAR